MIKDLITPKDIRLIEQKAIKGCITPDESKLMMMAKWSEFQIQSGAYNLFKSQRFGDSAVFVQIDNGGSAIEGLRKKKGATGTQSGFPDVEIKLWAKLLIGCFHRKTIYIEFKRIGGEFSENQQKWHNFLKEKGESVYYCNNLLFFDKIILKEIREFLGMV